MKRSRLSHRITWRVFGTMWSFNVITIGAILVFVFRVSLMNSNMRGQYAASGVEGRIESLLWAVHVGGAHRQVSFPPVKMLVTASLFAVIIDSVLHPENEVVPFHFGIPRISLKT